MKKQNAIIFKVTISDYNTGLWYGKSLNIESMTDEAILMAVAEFLENYRKENHMTRRIWHNLTSL